MAEMAAQGNAKAFIKQNKNYWLLIVLTFAYAVGVVLADKIIIFGRMADTFVVAPIIAAYLLANKLEQTRIRKLVLVAFLCFVGLAFFKSSFGKVTDYSDPKYVPYQTIFEVSR